MTKIAFAALLILLLLTPDTHSAKPNIIVIVADDLGYADLSFLPQSPKDVSTPAIDQLAKEGTYFSNAYSTSPICSPSRCGLITGRYQQRWGN
ncbi:MAG: sulfatase-like hydrolase/transferase, partial [Verrucomicrobiia bacterium]